MKYDRATTDLHAKSNMHHQTSSVDGQTSTPDHVNCQLITYNDKKLLTHSKLQ